MILPLILFTNRKEISIYFDGSHAVHMDMKGHDGMHVTEDLMVLVGKLKLSILLSVKVTKICLVSMFPN